MPLAGVVLRVVSWKFATWLTNLWRNCGTDGAWIGKEENRLTGWAPHVAGTPPGRQDLRLILGDLQETWRRGHPPTFFLFRTLGLSRGNERH